MQADQINVIALKVQRKFYTDPNKDSQRWASRHDQLLQAGRGLPKQELPATMLSMDYTRVWYTDRSDPHMAACACVSCICINLCLCLHVPLSCMLLVLFACV